MHGGLFGRGSTKRGFYDVSGRGRGGGGRLSPLLCVTPPGFAPVLGEMISCTADSVTPL